MPTVRVNEKNGKIRELDIPGNLVILPMKFRLTFAEVANSRAFNSVREAAEFAAAGEPSAVKLREDCLKLMLVLMEKDECVHTIRRPLGEIVLNDDGSQKTVRQSRWRLPGYQKSIAPGCEDAEPDYNFKWVQANWEHIFPFLEFQADTPGPEGKEPTKEYIAARLNPANPQRKIGQEVLAAFRGVSEKMETK